MKIFLYPHDCLRQATKEIKIEHVSTDWFKQMVSQMFNSMYYRGGVGLAATQIGWPLNFFVMNNNGRPNHTKDAKVIINPTISYVGDETFVDVEGCLSFPGLYFPVKRMKSIELTYLSMDGKYKTEIMNGFDARIVQHEIDHLCGILFIDRLDKEAKKRFSPQINSYIKRVRSLRKKMLEEAKSKKKKDRKCK